MAQWCTDVKGVSVSGAEPKYIDGIFVRIQATNSGFPMFRHSTNSEYVIYRSDDARWNIAVAASGKTINFYESAKDGWSLPPSDGWYGLCNTGAGNGNKLKTRLIQWRCLYCERCGVYNVRYCMRVTHAVCLVYHYHTALKKLILAHWTCKCTK